MYYLLSLNHSLLKWVILLTVDALSEISEGLDSCHGDEHKLIFSDNEETVLKYCNDLSVEEQFMSKIGDYRLLDDQSSIEIDDILPTTEYDIVALLEEEEIEDNNNWVTEITSRSLTTSANQSIWDRLDGESIERFKILN